MTNITTDAVEVTSPLERLVAQSGLETTKAQYILDRFRDYFKIASEWEEMARTIIVTSPDQVDDMKTARKGRLFLKGKRVEIENARKELKEQSLREGKAIDGIANVLKAVIAPIEEYLDQQEHFIENAEANRVAALAATRAAEIRETGGDPALCANLGTLSIDQYQMILTGLRRTKEDAQAAAVKAEEDRVAREVEAARIQEENAKLRAEMEKKERKIQQERREREKAEAELRAKEEEVRRERARVEAEARAKGEAEEAERRRQEKADRRAARAPDKEKLLAFARAIEELRPASVASKEAEVLVAAALKDMQRISDSLKKAAAEL